MIYESLDVKYTGYDTYKQIIDYNTNKYKEKNKKYSFVHLDFFSSKEQIKNGDLIILKDVLQHWKMKNI